LKTVCISEEDGGIIEAGSLNQNSTQRQTTPEPEVEGALSAVYGVYDSIAWRPV